MAKHISTIANDHLLEVERLQDENAKLKRKVACLEAKLKPPHTDADDLLDDDDSEGAAINEALDGVGR